MTGTRVGAGSGAPRPGNPTARPFGSRIRSSPRPRPPEVPAAASLGTGRGADVHRATAWTRLVVDCCTGRTTGPNRRPGRGLLPLPLVHPLAGCTAQPGTSPMRSLGARSVWRASVRVVSERLLRRTTAGDRRCELGPAQGVSGRGSSALLHPRARRDRDRPLRLLPASAPGAGAQQARQRGPGSSGSGEREQARSIPSRGSASEYASSCLRRRSEAPGRPGRIRIDRRHPRRRLTRCGAPRRRRS